MIKKHFFSISTAIIAACSNGAIAQNYTSPILGIDSVKVIKGWRQSDGSHMAAVHIKMEKGWKTYWRVAGGGGIPPVFDWTGSENIKSVEFKWPSPNIFMDYGLRTIGYKDELILPFVINPKTVGGDIQIKASMDFGVCEDVCVPVQVDLNAQLPQRAVMGKSLITQSLNKVATSGKSTGIQSATCNFKPTDDGIEIHANVRRNSGFKDQSVLILEYPTDDWLNQGETKVMGNTVQATAVLYGKNTPVLDRSKLRLTVLSDGTAIEIAGCTRAG